MHFNSSKTKTLPEVSTETHAIQSQDLNTLITGLKSREENLIELFDRNIKYKTTLQKKEFLKLQLVQTHHRALEEERERKENEILQKYQDFKVSDDKQKKLIEKLCKRIFELNFHAKKKLSELNIFEETKDSWDLVEQFEEKLQVLTKSFIVDFSSVLKCIINNSKKRFATGIAKIKVDDQIPKALNPTVKTEVESEHDVQVQRLIESSRLSYRKKSLATLEQQKNNYTTKHSENIANIIERSSSDKSKAFIQSMNAVRSEASYSWLFHKEPDNNRKSTEILKSVLLDKNEPSKITSTHLPKPGSAAKEKANTNACKTPKNGTRKKSTSKVELVKIEAQITSPMNLPSIKPGSKAGNRIKKPKQVSEEENDLSKKEQAPSYIFVDLTKADLVRNYDILKVEPNCFIFASKKTEAKKTATEKIYNELLSMNQTIKKSISSYAEQTAQITAKFPTAPKAKSTHLERPLNKVKRLTTPSLNHTNPIKNPSINSIDDSKYPLVEQIARKMESEPPELRTSIEKPILTKLRTQVSPQRSKVGRDIRVIQANLRAPRELLSFLKLDASPPKQDIPIRTLQDDFEKGLDFAFGSRTDEGIEVKLLKHSTLGLRFDHDKKPSSLEKLNQNRRSVGLTASPYNEFHKAYKDSKPLMAVASSMISNNSYMNETKLKTNNSQSTYSIIAKINEEHYINQKLINNNRFF